MVPSWSWGPDADACNAYIAATGQDLIDLFEHAQKNNYAIPAVNCTSNSIINGVMEAAKVGTPCRHLWVGSPEQRSSRLGPEGLLRLCYLTHTTLHVLRHVTNVMYISLPMSLTRRPHPLNAGYLAQAKALSRAPQGVPHCPPLYAYHALMLGHSPSSRRNG